MAEERRDRAGREGGWWGCGGGMVVLVRDGCVVVVGGGGVWLGGEGGFGEVERGVMVVVGGMRSVGMENGVVNVRGMGVGIGGLKSGRCW